MPHPHFLLVTYPAQGHINPALQFAHRLILAGARVTFATTVSAFRRMTTKGPLPDGLTFTSFSDGYDDGFRPSSHDTQHYMSEVKRRGMETITELIETNRKGDYPFTCVVYTLLLTWAARVARANQLPSALLWVQPATVFDIYYYYFNGYGDVVTQKAGDPSCVIELPGLPPLRGRDLPSFILPSNEYTFALRAFQEQIELLGEDGHPKVLLNTFDDLEPEALKAIENVKMVAVGPLIPSRLVHGKNDDPADDSLFGADLFQGSKDYSEWLDSKPESSVIYVSFGTVAVLSKQQIEEVAYGLIDSGRPFLWVITDKSCRGEKEREEDKISCALRQRLDEQGMIVSWCSQVEVLRHKSVGCFLTHCGWNSTLESLVFGMPVVAFPQWVDQMTNAKLIEDSWKTGVRVRENEKGLVERGEISRCLEAVMAEEFKRNAEKWRGLAAEAAARGNGSSDKNLKAFVYELANPSCESIIKIIDPVDEPFA